MAANLEDVSEDAEPDLDESKLWIGNLDSTVTEYQLLQILKRYGEIKKFEFLFHMHGPLKGKPRGYCFVKFETKPESENALKELNGKQLQSKKIIVNWAKKQQISDELGTPLKNDEKCEQRTVEDSKKKKIKAIEAKLRLMEQGIETTCSSSLKEKYSASKNVVRTGSHPYRKNRRKQHKR